MEEKKMILVNTDYITGKELDDFDRLSVVQRSNSSTRKAITKRMVMEAQSMDADAVVNVRYASSAVMQGAAEVIAYGTAVRFK